VHTNAVIHSRRAGQKCDDYARDSKGRIGTREHEEPMRRGNFWTELKRRNVYRVAVAYIVTAWLVIQAASTVLITTFQAPHWVLKVIVVTLILGLPVALVLSWAFEITPEGVKWADEIAPQKSIARRTGRKLVGFTVLLAALATGLFIYRLIRQETLVPELNRTIAAVFPVAEKSIAVLPFENLSRDPDNAFFTDGVQDEILTDLAKVADLKVISRTSVMQYKSGLARNLGKIGGELGVTHLLEGSVQRAGNKVRVNAQLIDARSDAHLWAQTYDRKLADVFAIQSDIAKTIADQLQAKLSPNEKKAIELPPTNDLAAFDLYNRAKSLLLTANLTATGDSDRPKAVELLDEAVKRDPSFFDAYCHLARAQRALYAVNGLDHTPARLALAESALQAAERLRPEASETHLARAEFLCHGLRDYAGALAELGAARKALPNDTRLFELTGYILRRRGQQEEWLRNLARSGAGSAQLLYSATNNGQLRILRALCLCDRCARSGVEHRT